MSRKARRSEQRVAKRMNRHISVTVAQKSQRMVYAQTAQPKLPSLHETVHVKTESCPNIEHMPTICGDGL